MDKGVTARQNLMLMRYARSLGIDLHWNLLWGFPGDEREAYEQMLALIPLIHHLQPPKGLGHLSIDRFSPYFDRAAQYGIANLRPLAGYEAIFPAHADLPKLAYHFIGDYRCGAYAAPETMRGLAAAVRSWCAAWSRGDQESLPVLRVVQQGRLFILYDRRGLPGTEDVQILDREQASDVLLGAPLTADLAWATELRLVFPLDSWFVPLATAAPELLQELEQERTAMRGAPATVQASLDRGAVRLS
jgi:hypothetical protein